MVVMMHILDTSRNKYNEDRQQRVDCYFCDADVIVAQNCTRFHYEYWYVLVNKHPYQNGNVMVIPKAHKTTLRELNEVEWQEFSHAIVDVQQVLQEHFDTDSFNIALNEGEASGRSVAHLHWQVIPRWFKNQTAVGIFSDIHVVTMAPDDLKALLSKKTADD